VKERIPRAVRQLDKSKPPFGFEPFDDSAYRRSRRRLEPRCRKARRASEFAQMRIVAVIVEVASAGLTKIPVSDQVGFLSSRFTAQSRPRGRLFQKIASGASGLICSDKIASRRVCSSMVLRLGWVCGELLV